MRASTKRVKCKICKEAFEFPSQLKHHSVIHSRKRPFACEVCGKKFKRRYNLSEHMELHSSSVECSICGMDKKRYSYLRNHMVRVHGLQGKKLKTALDKSVKTENDENKKTTPVRKNDEREEEEEINPVPEPKPQLQNMHSNKRKSACKSEKPLAKKARTEGTRKLRSQRNESEEPIEFENQPDEPPRSMPMEDQNQSQSALQPNHQEVSMSQIAVGSLEKQETAMDKSVEKKNGSVMRNDGIEKEVKDEVDPVPETKPQLQNMYSNNRKLASDLEMPSARNVKVEDATDDTRNQQVDLNNSQSSSAHMKSVNQEPIVFENNDPEKEVKEEVDPVPETKPQLQKIDSKKRKLTSDLDKSLTKKVKTEDTTQSPSTHEKAVKQEKDTIDHTLCSQPIKPTNLVDSQSTSALMNAVKQEPAQFEDQSDETPKSMPLEDQNQSQSTMHPIHEAVSMSQNAVGSQHCQGALPMVPAPVVQQQTPSNFEEDSRQISHQILRVAANSTKERQDCFRQLMFATVFAFESSPTCTNVEDFFRMMGERYAKK